MNRARSRTIFSGALQEVVSRGLPAELPVRGASMQPLLRDGDCLRIAPASAAGVPLGAVVVWLAGGKPVTHRLLVRWRGPGGWRILTKGDACLRLDPPQPADRLVAYALAVRRGQRVYRLDRGWRRRIALAMAGASLASGLAAEAWDRLAGRRGSR